MMSITLRNPLPDLDFFRFYILMIEEDEHCCGGEYSPVFDLFSKLLKRMIIVRLSCQ